MPTLPRAVYPLLAGSALLMFAGGVNGLILPVRGATLAAGERPAHNNDVRNRGYPCPRPFFPT